MSKAETLRKLTIANTGWTKGAIFAELMANCGVMQDNGKGKEIQVLPDGSQVSLMKIVGETTSAEPGQTDTGEYIKLKGTFQAINCDTGEVFTAAVCILPNFISDQLAEALKFSSKVEFAIEIGAKAKSNAVTGYEFTCTSLMEAKPTSAMEKLLALAGMSGNLLQAPTEPKATATETPAAKKPK